jgi:hypothetical protein
MPKFYTAPQHADKQAQGICFPMAGLFSALLLGPTAAQAGIPSDRASEPGF